MKMLFGKYRNQEIDTLPYEYLKWLAENIELYGPLANAVNETLEEYEIERELYGRVERYPVPIY